MSHDSKIGYQPGSNWLENTYAGAVWVREGKRYGLVVEEGNLEGGGGKVEG